MKQQSLAKLEKLIGYSFNKKHILKTALSHSSYINENRVDSQNNERLEFLGDSILGMIVSEYLFKNQKDITEGELTRIRSKLVCESSLYGFAKKIKLGEFLLLGKGEETSGGRERPSMLADTFEALIAAIYLDGGLDQARNFILRFVKEELENIKPGSIKDYKTTLQEIIQQNPEEKLVYVLRNEFGPQHNKEFEIDVMLNSNCIGTGKGRSKKEAEQMAAKQALELMGQ